MVHLELMVPMCLLVSLEIACTKAPLRFLVSPSLLLPQRRLVCQGHSVNELYVGADPDTQRCIVPV